MANAKGTLSRRIRAFAVDLPDASNVVKQAFAKEFLTTVIPATPARTGKARSNWNVGIGAPDFGIRDTEGVSGDITLQRGVATIAEVQSGQAIHISNGLPYISDLNNGASRQAPAGFVERAFDASKALLDRIRFGVNRNAT